MLSRQDGTVSALRMGLDSCLRARRAAITNVNTVGEEKMRCLSQHLVDLNRAPHFRARIIASF